MQSWLSEMIQQGGPGAVTVLYLGGPALAISIFHAVHPMRWAVWSGAILVALMLAIGVSGYFQARSRTDHAVASWSHDGKMTPQDIADMRERGYLEARRPLQFGGV